MPRETIALVVVVLIATGAPGGGAAKKELARLRGHWKAVKLVQEGKPLPTEELSAVISGDTFTMKTGGEEQVSRIQVDPSKRPATIDIQPKKPKAKVVGIYKLEGNKLTICFAVGGKLKRPQKFTATKGSGNALLELEKTRE